MRCFAKQDGRRCGLQAAPQRRFCDYHRAEAARGWLRAIGLHAKLGGAIHPLHVQSQN
jgi:hypothetical protein